VASAAHLEVFNLGSGTSQAVISFEAPITCVSYYHTCAFVYVGLESGDVNLVNVDGWSKSLYKISSKDVELPPGVKHRSVISIAINPERDDVILLGFACGAINEWEIKTSKVLRRYLSDKPLGSVVWDPSGNKMLAGHANGELVVWTRKKSIADEIYHPVVNPQKPSPIKRVYWVAPKASSSDTTTVVLGGTDLPHGIVIDQLKSKKRTFVPLTQPGMELRDICMIYGPSAASNAVPHMEPIAVVAVDARGHIFCHALYSEVDERTMLPSINAPLPFSLDSVAVVASLVFSEPMELLHDLVACGNIDPSDAMKGQTSNLNWPLTGGNFVIDPTNAPVIMVTLMSNNTVIFWDLSMRNCRVPIYRIRLPGMLNPQTNLVFDFCPVSRILHVGNNHELFVYHFSSEERAIQLMSIDDSVSSTSSSSTTSSPVSGSANSPQLPSNQSQATSLSSSSPTQQQQTSQQSPQQEQAPKSVYLDEAPPTPPATITAAAPSEAPSSPRQLSDSGSSASSASTAAAAAAAAVPNNALSSSSSSTSSTATSQQPPVGPSTPKKQASQQTIKSPTTPITTSSPQFKGPTTSSSSLVIPPGSPTIIHPNIDAQPSLTAPAAMQSPPSAASSTTSSPPSQKRVVLTPMPSQPSGFQFVGTVSLDGKSIQCIKFESGLQLLAVSTVDGKVRVFKTCDDYAKVFVYTPPANTLPCPPIVTHLQFCETMVNNTEEHLLLIMGMDLGSVQTISLTQPSRQFKVIAARKSPVMDTHLVRHRGDHMNLCKKPWNAGSKKGNSTTADNAKYFASHNVPKLLVVCTVNDVRTYKVPEFEMVSQYECNAPIAWFGTINVNVDVQGKIEPEYVIAAIDMGSNVLFIRLMNLTLVSYAGPNNLTKMGVDGVSPMATSRSCNLLDGTVILHTDTSETYVVKLMPYIEQRAITKLLGPEPPKPVAKRAKGIKGFLGKDKEVNFEEVFGPRKEIGAAAAASSSSAVSTAPNAPPKPVSAGAAKAQGQIGEVKGVMNENMDRLRQRGEKLSDLADRSNQMAEASHSFASLAKQLADQQKKSWF
jgi:hypothetical protein